VLAVGDGSGKAGTKVGREPRCTEVEGSGRNAGGHGDHVTVAECARCALVPVDRVPNSEAGHLDQGGTRTTSLIGDDPLGQRQDLAGKIGQRKQHF
jgi:hypothetical protein